MEMLGMRRYKAHRCTCVVPDTTFTELNFLIVRNFGGEAGVFGGESSPPPPPVDRTLLVIML